MIFFFFFCFGKPVAGFCALLCLSVSLEPAETYMSAWSEGKTRHEQPVLKLWE